MQSTCPSQQCVPQGMKSSFFSSKERSNHRFRRETSWPSSLIISIILLIVLFLGVLLSLYMSSILNCFFHSEQAAEAKEIASESADLQLVALNLTTESDTASEHVEKYRLRFHGAEATFAQVLQLMAVGNDSLISILTKAFRESKHEAIFWECAPISSDELESKAFEFVILPAPYLSAKEVDMNSFADKFTQNECHQSVVTFGNLGGDSQLVVPCPVNLSETENKVHSRKDYQYMTHLASYHRGPLLSDANAKLVHDNQVMSLWINTGKLALKLLNDRPGVKLWLSTSGMGVSWLHIRLDSRPKYYNYLPYKVDLKTT